MHDEEATLPSPLDPRGGVRGDSTLQGVRHDILQEAPRPPSSRNCLTIKKRKPSDSTNK